MKKIENTKQISIIYQKISELIKKSKQKVAQYINSELILLNWNIGKIVFDNVLHQNRANYGKNIIDSISRKLTQEYGSGFSSANISRMIKLYNIFPKEEILATLSQKLSWSHLIEIIKIEDTLKREFYIKMIINERWSVRVLKNRINSMLFERTAISKKPDVTILHDLELMEKEKKMTPELVLKDPYILDFLNLKNDYSEKDFEEAILNELEKFLLELGTDFAFLARQKRITIDGNDYYIDLLFFHRKMQRLVIIELKLGKFKPQDKGQMELYLRWLEKYEKNPSENSPIGLILCAEKTVETIELLELDKSGIHVAQYLTELPPKKVLVEKLNNAIVNAKIRFTQDRVTIEINNK